MHNYSILLIYFYFILDHGQSSSRQFRNMYENECTIPFSSIFFHSDNDIVAASTQDEKETLLYHDLYDDLVITPLENLDEEFGVMVVPHYTPPDLEEEMHVNNEVPTLSEENQKKKNEDKRALVLSNDDILKCITKVAATAYSALIEIKDFGMASSISKIFYSKSLIATKILCNKNFFTGFVTPSLFSMLYIAATGGQPEFQQ